MARSLLDTFPLPWERLLWSAAPGGLTGLSHPGTTYVLTDLRLAIRRGDRTVGEVALDDVADVELTQTFVQRFTATSTVRVLKGASRGRLTLRDIAQGPQLALILQLIASEHFVPDLDEDFVRSALAPDAPRLLSPNRRLLGSAAAALCMLLVAVAGATHHTSIAPVSYAADDPIAPNGRRRPTADIIAFMETDVMPFAMRVLAPIVGGGEKVSCETCHGADAHSRGWKMPGVRALPEPELRLAGMERLGFWLDPQVRNAVYGYLAEEQKLPTASYMRRVVMPGMAALLHRPAYDFTRSYGYNRAHAAVGCYHCHLIDSRP